MISLLSLVLFVRHSVEIQNTSDTKGSHFVFFFPFKWNSRDILGPYRLLAHEMGHNFAMGHDGTKVLLSKFGFFYYYRVIAQSLYFHGNVNRLLKDPFVTSMLCVAVCVCMYVCLCVSMYRSVCIYV